MSDKIYDKVLTMEEAIEKHRKMWNWVADNCNEKVNKPVYELIKMFIHNNEENPNLFVNSYCCEYAAQQIEKRYHYMGRCLNCPLNWGSQRDMYGCQYLTDELQEDGLFSRVIKLSDNGNYEEAQGIARQIANLPVTDLSEEKLNRIIVNKKLTKERAVEEHRKMWNWIAENCNKESGLDIDDLKKKYLNSIGKAFVRNNCFCCEYAEIESFKNIQGHMCDYCPLEWGSEDKLFNFFCENKEKFDDDKGLYSVAQDAITIYKDYESASKIALKIANLPEKK